MGDTKIEQFLSRWNSALMTVPTLKGPIAVEQLFLRQLRKSVVLQQDVAHHERLASGSQEKTYTFLVDAAKRYLERERMEKSHKELEKFSCTQAT